MAQLTPSPIVRADLFTASQDVDGTLLVAEMSDLPGRGALGRVYDDACDVGLTLVGPTGRQRVFAVAGEHRDQEGELLWVNLALTPESARESRLNGLSDRVRIQLFND